MKNYELNPSYQSDGKWEDGERKIPRKGQVFSLKQVQSKFRKKAVEAVEAAYEGSVGEASVEGAERIDSARSAVSLGMETYLDAGQKQRATASVSEIQKSPLHRWKRNANNKGDGLRNPIYEFSKKSRMRLKKKVAEIRRGESCHFVTLTFHEDFTAAKAKEALWKFYKQMDRLPTDTGKKQGIIWKMEPQKNGNWHFHIFWYGWRFMPAAKMKWRWQKIIQSEGHKCAYDVGVDVRFVKGSHSKINAYVSKYFSKSGEEIYNTGEECIGRIWGARGTLPREEKEDIGMTVLENVWLWRIISRKRKKNVVDMNPIFFAEFPEDFLAAARILAADSGT